MRLCLLVLMLLASPAFGQTLKLPTEVKGEPGAFVPIKAETDCATVKWIAIDAGLNLFPVELLKDTKTAVVSSTKAGRYRVFAVAAKGDIPTDPAICVVVIGTPTPGPTPDPGPGPTPGPDNPAPIPDAGFRVLMVYESAQLADYPSEQAALITSVRVRTYLNAKCVVGADGRTKEWRIWDKDIDASTDADLWKKALARKRASLPWLIISDGKTGYEGPLPKKLDELMSLLEKYGGK